MLAGVTLGSIKGDNGIITKKKCKTASRNSRHKRKKYKMK